MDKEGWGWPLLVDAPQEQSSNEHLQCNIPLAVYTYSYTVQSVISKFKIGL